jgi:hypothetical protein
MVNLLDLYDEKIIFLLIAQFSKVRSTVRRHDSNLLRLEKENLGPYMHARGKDPITSGEVIYFMVSDMEHPIRRLLPPISRLLSFHSDLKALRGTIA